MVAFYRALGLVVREGPRICSGRFGDHKINKPVSLEGTITRVEWINPHSWIHIDVEAPDGTVQKWMIESRAAPRGTCSGEA